MLLSGGAGGGADEPHERGRSRRDLSSTPSAVSLPFVLRNPPGILEACDDDNDDVIREPCGYPLTVALWDEP